MVWMKASFEFGQRCAIIVLSEFRLRKAALNGVRSLYEAEGNPDIIETLLTDLIVSVRPDLKGIIVDAMTFDMQRQAWLVRVTHEKFEPVPWNEKLPEFDL